MNEFNGLFVSQEILSDTNLTTTEKILLSVLKSDLFDDTVTNRALADFLQLSIGTISKLISSLEKKGYIETNIIYNYEISIHECAVKTTARKIKIL